MLRSHNFNCFKWQYLLVGLFIVTMQCDARAVNVSNTWTMPQEGLNVFYRFFRDRISWFEADAVCQFHHANLVTVDNSFQFDATRDLLRELDVNDIVWIGLMRPQSSDRFMWSSNSRPLVADTGYWAESLPLMDAPLCAVIDPIRDYRWHALRCGGPETASFLCEMPVPSWADACNLKDMPNLTLQYMADTASIELIRNCQEEGLLRSMCRGKQDRERAMRDLICPRERLEAQRINDITNSHFKSLQIINSIPSDNNENNDIELLPLEVNYGPHYPEELQTEKNTVQRLIEQFNVDELMQADEPSNMETVSSFYKIPGLIPKPVKKSGKKIMDYNKKVNTKAKALLEDPQKVKKPSTMDDMMMGDQPLQGEPELNEQFLNEEVSNEILEPLPHIKKTNIHKEDMEKMEKEAIALKKNMQKAKEVENKKMFAMMSSTASYTTKPTTTGSTTTEESKTTASSTTATATTTKLPLIANKDEMLVKEKQHDITTTASVSIGHPIHPQQQQQLQSIRNQQLFNEDQHQQQHNKEAADNSHFIPPMLLVKSHYVPPASKHGHNEHEHHTHSHHLDITNEKPHQIRNETETDFKETTIRTSTTAATKTTTTALNLAVEMTTLKSQDPPNLTAETDSSLKAIAQQPTTEEEKHKNLENLHSKETQTTMTTTTSHPVSYTNNDEDSQKPATVAFSEITSIKDKSNKNEEEVLELKTPQTINANTETTAATKLLTTTADKATENLFDLETTEPATKIVSKENEDEKVVVEATINSEAATQTPTEITAAMATEKITENLKYTAGPDNDNKLALIADNKNEEQEEREKKQQQQQLDDKKETIIKTTDILGISMASTTTTTTANTATEIVEAESKTEGNLKKVAFTTTTLVTKTANKPTATNTTPQTVPTTVATASISLTTTTTVKPITTTTTVIKTMPQNEIKSTETSVSSVRSTTATNTNTNTNTDNYNENNSPTNTLAPSSAKGQTTTAINTDASTTLKTLRTETSIETETVLPTTEKLPASSAEAVAAAVSADTIEIATSIPASLTPETTTRNFLKSTTETPFKPNRRRSLTKPETVSYMKKILG